jgi:hypothetical protein
VIQNESEGKQEKIENLEIAKEDAPITLDITNNETISEETTNKTHETHETQNTQDI